MEKDGAISSDTPCCRSGCRNLVKQSSQHPDAIARQEMLKQSDCKQKKLFPQNDEDADSLDFDLTKAAIDIAANQSKVDK